jgi:hypothetical protein
MPERARPTRDHAAIPAALRPLVALAVCLVGCGTTNWSDSKRTATEQLLVSDAIERAVMKVDMRPLAGHRVFLDTTALSEVADKDYLQSTVRQHVLGSGAVLAEKREEAEIVVEARAGAIGTDRSSVLVGMPQMSLQIAGNGTSLPEMALLKRSDQRAVAKINLFAYHRTTGQPVWQSGLANVATHSRDRWFMGAGPFQDGRIHDRIEFAGEKIRTPWARTIPDDEELAKTFDLMQPRVFAAAPPAGTATVPATADRRPVDLPPVR